MSNSWRENFGTNRSRGSFLPFALMRSADFVPPPWRAVAIFTSKSLTNSSIAAALAVNSGEEVDTLEDRTAAWYPRLWLDESDLHSERWNIEVNMEVIVYYTLVIRPDLCYTNIILY